MIEARSFSIGELQSANARRRLIQREVVGVNLYGGRGVELGSILDQTDRVVSSMQQTHQDWIEKKLDPLREYLHLLPVKQSQRLTLSSSFTRLERSFREGLASAVKQEYFHAVSLGDGELPQQLRDPSNLQTIVAGYTVDFIRTLRVCQERGIAPRGAMDLAKYSYRNHPNMLESILDDSRYQGIPTNTIVHALRSANPHDYLSRFINNSSVLLNKSRKRNSKDRVKASDSPHPAPHSEESLDIEDFFVRELEFARSAIDEAISAGRYRPNLTSEAVADHEQLASPDKSSQAVGIWSDDQIEGFVSRITKQRGRLVGILTSTFKRVTVYEAEDILQNTAIRLVKALRFGGLSQRIIEDEEEMDRLVIRAMKFEAIEEYRRLYGRRTRRLEVSLDELYDGENGLDINDVGHKVLSHTDPAFDEVEHGMTNEYLQFVKETLPHLGMIERRAFILRVFFGLTNSEVAQILDKKSGNIDQALAQMRRKLKRRADGDPNWKRRDGRPTHSPK